MSEEPISAGGEREPAASDRPPISRVGDELQERAENVTHEPDAGEIQRLTDEAFNAAQRKGWDKDLSDDS